MVVESPNVEVKWVTSLTSSEVRAESDLFEELYPGFVRDVTAKYDRFEQLAFTMGRDGEMLGCAGSRRRIIEVGGTDLVISGVGGVMTKPRARQRGIANQTLSALAQTFSASGRCESDFGFLQCRTEIVSFYQNVGWIRVFNPVTHVDHLDGRSPTTSTGPVMILPGRRRREEWPDGSVDLRGLPW